MPTSIARWPATSAAVVPTRASAPRSRTQHVRSPHEENGMHYERLMRRLGAAPQREGIDRRGFLKLGAASGFALGLFAASDDAPAQATPADTALKANQQPAAFVRIAP